MRKWIRRGFNILTALVMLAIVIKHPGFIVQLALFGLAGFNTGWWVHEKHVEEVANAAISGALKSNRPVRVTRWTIPPE